MPKVNGLTEKQKSFCENIVKGMTVAEAYTMAYNSKGKPTTANIEGTRLLKREAIQEHIKALQKPLEVKEQAKALTEREKKRAIIWEEIENARAEHDHTAIARYMDILNKMDAEYININRNINDEGEKLDSLDVDALKTLLQPSPGD